MTREELTKVAALIHSCWPQWIEDRKSQAEGGEVLFNAEKMRALWDWFNRYRLYDVCREIRSYYRANPDGFPKLARIVEGVKHACGLGMAERPRWSWRDENTLEDIRRRTRIDMEMGRHFVERGDDGERHPYPITAECLTDEWILAKNASSFGCQDPTEHERRDAQSVIQTIRTKH